MPQLNSYADVFADLERLLAAANGNAELLPGLEGAKAPLEQSIATLRSLMARRENLNAEKLALTADLQLEMQRGREVSSEFRGFARSHLGMRNEKLAEFRIPPKRLGARAKRGNGFKAKRGQPAAVNPGASPVSDPAPASLLAQSLNPEGGAKAQE